MVLSSMNLPSREELNRRIEEGHREIQRSFARMIALLEEEIAESESAQNARPESELASNVSSVVEDVSSLSDASESSTVALQAPVDFIHSSEQIFSTCVSDEDPIVHGIPPSQEGPLTHISVEAMATQATDASDFTYDRMLKLQPEISLLDPHDVVPVLPPPLAPPWLHSSVSPQMWHLQYSFEFMGSNTTNSTYEASDSGLVITNFDSTTGGIHNAFKVFDRLPEQVVVVWPSLKAAESPLVAVQVWATLLPSTKEITSTAVVNEDFIDSPLTQISEWSEIAMSTLSHTTMEDDTVSVSHFGVATHSFIVDVSLLHNHPYDTEPIAPLHPTRMMRMGLMQTCLSCARQNVPTESLLLELLDWTYSIISDPPPQPASPDLYYTRFYPSPIYHPLHVLTHVGILEQYYACYDDIILFQLSSHVILSDLLLTLDNTYSLPYFCNVVMKSGLVLCNLAMAHGFGSLFWIEPLYGVLQLEPLTYFSSKRTCATSCHEIIPVATSVHTNLQLLEATHKSAKSTLIGVIVLYSKLSNGSYGYWTECNVIDYGLIMNDQLATTLIDIYAKCGNFGKANELFGQVFLDLAVPFDIAFILFVQILFTHRLPLGGLLDMPQFFAMSLAWEVICTTIVCVNKLGSMEEAKVISMRVALVVLVYICLIQRVCNEYIIKEATYLVNARVARWKAIILDYIRVYQMESTWVSTNSIMLVLIIAACSQVNDLDGDCGKANDIGINQFVLVYGGSCEASCWCWYKTLEIQAKDGYKVATIDFTCYGVFIQLLQTILQVYHIT